MYFYIILDLDVFPEYVVQFKYLLTLVLAILALASRKFWILICRLLALERKTQNLEFFELIYRPNHGRK